MHAKHPHSETPPIDSLRTGNIPAIDLPTIFASLDGQLIKKSILRTEGAAGVSQADEHVWHKMVCSFKDSSVDLCNSLAAAARRIATTFIDPESISTLLANRGIPLNKNPGLRPIGIGEILRRAIGKSIMAVVKSDVEKHAGALQLCAGQSAGVEAAIHAMKQIYEAETCDGILLLDAENAFNRVNKLHYGTFNTTALP